jgi:hypothetical protein
MKKKPIKVIYSKLGQYKAVGLAWKEDRVIAIDKRLKGINELETIIHEIEHIQNPEWSETKVTNTAKEKAQILWDLGFIKVDNG